MTNMAVVNLIGQSIFALLAIVLAISTLWIRSRTTGGWPIFLGLWLSVLLFLVIAMGGWRPWL